jgi:hypothetical protein
MRGTIRLLGLLSAALLGLSARSASASLVQALSLAELTSGAEQVFVGRVIAEESHYDEHERIVTDVRLQVEEPVKGRLAAGQSVTIRRQGGVVGDIGTRVLGEPSFQSGETVVLFAARQGREGVMRTVGMAQGALRVFDEGGRRWVRSAPGDAAIVKRSATGALVRAEVAVPSPRRLDDLLSEVRTLSAH